MCKRLIDCLKVALYHCLTAFAVGLLNAFLDLFDSLVLGKDATDREEAGLHYLIDAPSHTSVTGYLVGVNHKETQPLLKDHLLHLEWADDPTPPLLHRCCQAGRPRQALRT